MYITCIRLWIVVGIPLSLISYSPLCYQYHHHPFNPFSNFPPPRPLKRGLGTWLSTVIYTILNHRGQTASLWNLEKKKEKKGIDWWSAFQACENLNNYWHHPLWLFFFGRYFASIFFIKWRISKSVSWSNVCSLKLLSEIWKCIFKST
jgi:hypothetical protein